MRRADKNDKRFYFKIGQDKAEMVKQNYLA